MADQKKEMVLGKFIGNLLESLPVNSRGRAIREIKAAEEKYRPSLEGHRQDLPSLSLQLLRIEHNKMFPRIEVEPITRWKNVPKNYGEAVETYMESIPATYREKALKTIHGIVSSFAVESYGPGS